MHITQSEGHILISEANRDVEVSNFDQQSQQGCQSNLEISALKMKHISEFIPVFAVCTILGRFNQRGRMCWSGDE
eukprot:scaffold600080_cov37-Prasinocladus_malaysianus.AAC.1